MTSEPLEDLNAREAQMHLERAYIEEYLRGVGQSFDGLKLLPEEKAHELMRAASLYASMRLSEVEARSHLAEEMHGGPAPM